MSASTMPLKRTPCSASSLCQNSFMTMLDESQLLEIYFRYLRDRKYVATKIPEGNVKTPDLLLTRGERTNCNEFKSPELILNDEMGMFLFKTTYSKLLTFVGTAVKQLRSYDSNHSHPWIVTFASCHMQLSGSDFADALSGGMKHFDGSRLPPGFDKTDVFKRSFEYRYQPDLYLWLQVNPITQSLYQATFVVNDQSLHRDQVDIAVAELSQKPLSDMDRYHLLQ